MNYNLNCLRENYCRPATIVGKTMHHLFPLERECDQGRIVRAKAPEQLLHLQELDPRGLEQTYRDEASGAELPVFAVFNLEGDHRCTFEIAPESVPKNADPASLQAHIPFTKTQAFVRKINERRIKAQRLVALMCVMLVCLPATVYLVLLTIGMVAPTFAFIVVAGKVLGGLLAYIVSVSVLDRVCPWIELFITAEFEGILPREARERARTAKDQFDNLYLIVDQQTGGKARSSRIQAELLLTRF